MGTLYTGKKCHNKRKGTKKGSRVKRKKIKIKKGILKLRFGSGRVIFGISYLGLGNEILDDESSLCTLGLW